MKLATEESSVEFKWTFILQAFRVNIFHSGAGADG
jgi:hypothetical protein